jgi:hypothetical protein
MKKMSDNDYGQSDSSHDMDIETPEMSDVEDEYSPPSDDLPVKTDIIFSPMCIATTTCLHKYAIGRLEGAQDETLPWPPLMLAVISYLNKTYTRRELVTERNIAMLELLLKVPIQLRIKRGNNITLDLNNNASLDFSGVSFPQSLEILRDLIGAGIVKKEDVRVPENVLHRY